MLKRWYRTIQHRVLAFMRLSGDQMDRRQRFLRMVIDVARVAGRKMRRDRSSMMAAALTYRLLFALVPLMVIAAAVMQMVVSREYVTEATQEIVAHLQLDSIKVHDQRLPDMSPDMSPDVSPDVSPDAAQTSDSTPFTMGNWIMSMAARAMDYDASGLTIIGSLVLFYSAIKLFREIEVTFSIVSGQRRRRLWWRRWGMFVLVLLLGPLVLVAGLWLLHFGSQHLTDLGSGHAGLVAAIEQVVSWLLTWALIVVCYLYIPSTRLSLLAVAGGALLATVTLLIAHLGFRIYVQRAVMGSPAGSLGLVPLFLFWLYLNWLCLIFGLQFSSVMARVSRLRRRIHIG